MPTPAVGRTLTYAFRLMTHATHNLINWQAMATQPDSRLTYAPILLGVAFIATLFMVAESGYKRLHDAGLAISAAEERQALLSRYLRLVLDAENAQRGFLLTEDKRYLRDFRSGRPRARSDA